MALNPLDHPIMFELPALEAPSEWIEHVPFGLLLIDLIRPRTVVELGVYAGVSYCAFCQAAQRLQLATRCFGVDTWRGDEHGGYFGDEVLKTLRSHHDPRYSAFSQLIQSTFDDAALQFGDGSIDLLHIDGFHTYEAVKHDFDRWLPKISERGVVMFHDIAERREGFGVWEFWDEVSQRYPSFAFEHGHGLGVLCVGSQISSDLRPLLEMSSHQRDTFRELCCLRGQQLRALQSGAVQRQADIAAIRRYIEDAQHESHTLQEETLARRLEAADQMVGLLKLREQQAIERERQHRAASDARVHTLEDYVHTLEAQIQTLEDQIHGREERIHILEGQAQATKREAYEAHEAHIASLDAQVQSLTAALHASAWTEASRGVRTIKLARATRYLAKQRGTFYVLKRAAMWLVGKRGVGVEGHVRAPARSASAAARWDAPVTSAREPDAAEEPPAASYSTAPPRAATGATTGATTGAELNEAAARSVVTVPTDTREPAELAELAELGAASEHDESDALALLHAPDAATATEGATEAAAVDAEADEGAEATISALVEAETREQHTSPCRPFSGVSIVIPVFNALDYARQCVASIYAATSEIPFEIIVVDNGSDVDVLDWLRDQAHQHDNFWYISLSRNTGYARGINLGLKHAHGEYLVLANSDILATSHWLDLLVEVMDRDESIGVLSPLTNYVGHGPQLDVRAKALLPEQREAYASAIRADTTVEVEPNRLAFFCVMARKRVVSLLGGVSEDYIVGNYEDDDFCLRARMAGYTLAIAHHAFVYHFGTKSFEANNIDHIGYMLQNEIRFLDMASSLSTTLTQAPALAPTDPTDPVVSAPAVSVIVRTVDRPHLLKLALTSLANQTWRDFEVVVVCDGGPDISPLLDAFSPYLKVRYIRNEQPLGRSEALNTGVASAVGAYVTYLDDDDIVYPTHLETLIQAMRAGEREGPSFAYSDYNRALMTASDQEIATITRVPVPTWSYSYTGLLVQNYLPIHTWLHDRALWEEVGGFDSTLEMLEDWDFLIRIAQRRNVVPARRMTCEYRFYMTGANSVFTNRPQALRALKKVHARYPATRDIEDERERLAEVWQDQITVGNRLLGERQQESQSSEQAVRKYLAILAGFAE